MAFESRRAAVVSHRSQETIWCGFAGKVFLALDLAVHTAPRGEAEPDDTA